MLEKINSPEDVKKLTLSQKEKLAEEIRKYIIEIVSENGGHLASNLGVVELTIALHSIFDVPKDKEENQKERIQKIEVFSKVQN